MACFLLASLVEALQTVGLTGREHAPVGALSAGQIKLLAGFWAKRKCQRRLKSAPFEDLLLTKN
jgi:hypothetical protein